MICNKEICTGCYVCFNKCPTHCIIMKTDAMGFVYPSIIESECIKCGVCKKVCPTLNKVKTLYPKKCYAAWARDDMIHKMSASGGISAVAAQYIIEKNGVVYGATVDKELSVHHIRITEEKNLHLIQGSKYVQSYIMDTYTEVKKDLLKNRWVLFTGTPCQIAGLKKYLGKDYDQLILIDLVCHGVASQKMLTEEVQKLRKKAKKPCSLKFRLGNRWILGVEDKQKKIIYDRLFPSAFVEAFLKGLIYRENCYQCSYAKSERCGDLTIFDFWGLGNLKYLKKSLVEGISGVLVNTEKGLMFLEQFTDRLYIEERPIQEAIDGNDQLRHPSKKPQERQEFETDYSSGSFSFVKSVRKALNMSNSIYLKILLERIWGKLKSKYKC